MWYFFCFSLGLLIGVYAPSLVARFRKSREDDNEGG